MKRIINLGMVLLLALSLCILSGCEEKEQQPEMNVNLTEDGSCIYDGEMQYFYQVQEGEKGIAHISVTVVQGSIRFDIHEKDNERNQKYSGTITESCEFDVVLDEANGIGVSMSHVRSKRSIAKRLHSVGS